MTSGGGPAYTPFAAPYRMTMGMQALADGAWLQLDDDLADDLREKRRLLAERHDEVFVALPGSEPAQYELRDILIDDLLRHHPALYRQSGDRLTVVPLEETLDLSDASMAPLEQAARLVQEDLCVMERDAEVWRLTAASVCFPTRWNLVSKLGRSLDTIHAPVPGYETQLAAATNQLFDRLRVSRPVWRLNWSLVDDPALFQPGGHGRQERNPDIDADNAGDKVWLRVERQTLRRLPETGAIIFTIRIHRWPLRRLAAEPAAAEAMIQSIESMPADMQQYKSMPAMKTAVLGYLRNLTATAVPEGA